MTVDLSVPCPLVPGLHGWIYPGGRSEGWKTAREQVARLLELGFVGAIPQYGLAAPAWLAGKDPGETLCRYEIFQQAGIQVTCGLGMDGSNATRAAIVNAMKLALSLPNVLTMGDEESELRWENPEGRALAQGIDDDVLAAVADAYLRSVFAPWWAPDKHSAAPDRIFQKLFRHLFVQAYGAKGVNAPTDDTIDMLAHARIAYAVRGILTTYVHLAAQMYSHSLGNAGRILLCGEPVIALWDVEETDANFKTVLMVRLFLLNHRFEATTEGLETFQKDAGITVDGIVGKEVLGKCGLGP